MEEAKVISAAHTICYHCGEALPPHPLLLAGKAFCCAGCKGVYQILQEHHMCSYYAYNETPGRPAEMQRGLEYLDEPQIAARLTDYQDKENTLITFYIPAIHCSSCIWLLEHLYRINEAIYHSRIDFLKKEVTVSFKHQLISLREVVSLLTSIGYEPLISAQDVVKEHARSTDKSLILKIAVTGFCMGNVMLFSFPEYFGITNLESQFRTLFGWLNLILSVPVTFYGARDYFISAYTSLRHKRINLDTPLALIVAVLFIRTAVAVLLNAGPGFADTLTGLVFLLLMGKWVKQRTYHHISFNRDYRSYFPIAVTVLKEGKEKPVEISELQVGDRLWIRNGELIPADSILMKGNAWVDMSFVTGETEPQHKVLGEVIYAGGKQEGEAIEVEVVKPVSQSYLTGLWNRDYQKVNERSNFNDHIARYFTIAVFLIAFSAFGYWMVQTDSNKAWGAFTAVIIVACPCVLALSTPFTLSAILSVFDKKGFYVKNTDAVEQMAKCDAIVFDKTGTLTSTASAQIRFEGRLTSDEEKMAASLLKHSSHPLSRHILKTIRYHGFYEISDFREIPGKGMIAIVAGRQVRLGSVQILSSFAGNSGRNGVHLQIGDQYKGCFVVDQEWREGLPQLMATLAPTFELSILSGDTPKDEPYLRRLFNKETEMHFGQSPSQKLKTILEKQKAGAQVMMLGDGLNDAGALKQSDFGIALTDNVNNFTPGCDAILKGSSLRYLPNFYQLSKDGLKIIKISFAIAAAYNCIGLFYAVQGTLYPLVAAVLMPVSTITIISFTTLATRYYAKKNKLR